MFTLGWSLFALMLGFVAGFLFTAYVYETNKRNHPKRLYD